MSPTTATGRRFTPSRSVMEYRRLHSIHYRVCSETTNADSFVSDLVDQDLDARVNVNSCFAEVIACEEHHSVSESTNIRKTWNWIGSVWGIRQTGGLRVTSHSALFNYTPHSAAIHPSKGPEAACKVCELIRRMWKTHGPGCDRRRLYA